MAWKQLGVEGRLVKWDVEGAGVQGAFQGIGEGKFGPLGSVQAEDGQVFSFPVPTALGTKLADLKPGQVVRIKYLGTVTSATGRDYKNFSVELWQPEGEQEPAPPAPPEPAAEEAPF